jgi:C-terminal processing protease CtpA/Prc
MQLEKRGYVIGDQTAGRVKEAERIDHQEFTAGSTPHYYVSVSTGDVTMSDGKSLEGIGVTPDLLLLPTQADLAAGRDPVLAAAISLAGHPMDPADAGRLIPPK